MNPEVRWIMDYLDKNEMLEEMDNALHKAFHWIHDDHGYESKNARILEHKTNVSCMHGQDFYEIFCHIFAGCILHPEGMTYQAMIGYIQGNIKCESPLARAQCAAELIAIAHNAELVVITKVSDKTFMITTEYTLDEEIPEFGKHAPLFKKPALVDFNQILGNRFKQHDGDACIDHINTMNAIPLSLERRITGNMLETTDADLETPEQQEQWTDFRQRSYDMYNEVEMHGNKFYLEHSMDTRGRCYCKGYYVNYQGSSYKKAIVQLADKEVVKL
jgi:hypothetical protein